MNFFNIFKNRTPLQVGETRDDLIGCYMLIVEAPDGSSKSHHSLATSRVELLEDCVVLFTSLATMKKELINRNTPTSTSHAHDLRVIENALNNLSLFVDMHLKGNKDEPFFEFPGMRIFLGIGERTRDKVNGQFTE